MTSSNGGDARQGEGVAPSDDAAALAGDAPSQSAPVSALRAPPANAKITCPDCEGMGEWDEGPLPARSPVQIDPEYDRIICERCNGKGQLDKPDACDECGECVEDGQSFDHVVEAMEATDKLLCDSCFDNHCENAYQAQFEGEPPVSAQEQYERAAEQRRELRR